MKIATNLFYRDWTGERCPKCLKAWYNCKCKAVVIALLLFVFSNIASAQMYPTCDCLRIETYGNSINLVVTTPALGAPYHTITYIRHNPYAVWYSNQTNKWLPYHDSNYSVIITGILSTESVQQVYNIYSQPVRPTLVVQPLRVIKNEFKN